MMLLEDGSPLPLEFFASDLGVSSPGRKNAGPYYFPSNFRVLGSRDVSAQSGDYLVDKPKRKGGRAPFSKPLR